MSREKPSHIPLFPDAYLRDTTHLTTEEHGAYFLLLMAAWGTEDCSLPNDERRLAALAKMSVARWRKIAPNVLEFWTIERGRIWQGRLRKEWLYVNKRRQQARDAVAVRMHRNAQNRASDDASVDTSDDASKRHHPTNTLGGGVGVVSISHTQEEELGGRSHTHAREGLTVIPGGAK